MAYVAGEARKELLDEIARATDEIGRALASLGAAYEQLDDATGDRLEEQLFRPVQVAFGRARRTHTGFAERHGLPTREFAAPDSAGPPSTGVRGFIAQAQDSVAEADEILSDLQDSMRPVEVGDAELRAGLADVRAHLATVDENGRELIRIFGR